MSPSTYSNSSPSSNQSSCSKSPSLCSISIEDLFTSPEASETSRTSEPCILLEDPVQVTSNEREVIEWMRAHPKESFVVDNDCRISALIERSAALRDLSPFSGQNPLEEEHERVDLTNKPAPAEGRKNSIRRRKGIYPGAFGAVAGHQEIVYRRKGDRKHVQTSAYLRDGAVVTGSQVQSSQPSMSVAGASVLLGASNIVIRGGSIAPGAFSAMTGNQEICSNGTANEAPLFKNTAADHTTIANNYWKKRWVLLQTISSWPPLFPFAEAHLGVAEIEAGHASDGADLQQQKFPTVPQCTSFLQPTILLNGLHLPVYGAIGPVMKSGCSTECFSPMNPNLPSMEAQMDFVGACDGRGRILSQNNWSIRGTEGVWEQDL
ncbi:hypothetical protein EV368DRAFT_89973 [Lentinula lateritia]|nr:hypothetical protein EV368DRAFT_89973 [Lentinula lateritia]